MTLVGNAGVMIGTGADAADQEVLVLFQLGDLHAVGGEVAGQGDRAVAQFQTEGIAGGHDPLDGASVQEILGLLGLGVHVGAQGAVQAAGASILRGGAFKPRTSPYSFQGLRAEGLELLQEARAVTGQPIVTELMNNEHIPLFVDAKVDMIQIGARNMQNFELLKAVGKLNVPVLLKRGLSSTLEELVMSAEYIMAEGNENVILCERGIRTFETSMRNTLDLAGVVMLHKMTHLPVVVDPSHACGHAWMVPQLAKAAVAAGADGLMIEVHNNPAKAKCDGAQSLTPDQFDELMGFITKEVEFFGKKMN